MGLSLAIVILGVILAGISGWGTFKAERNGYYRTLLATPISLSERPRTFRLWVGSMKALTAFGIALIAWGIAHGAGL
jgi:hypothetical protein